MTARIPFVCGNWKMFTSAQSGKALASAIVAGVKDSAVRVAVCPPFPYLPLIAAVVAGSRVELGAQNAYPAVEGAFTGEVSPPMLKDVGCKLVIVGHSERRHGIGEQNEFINQKVRAVLAADLDVIFCVGETLAQREAGDTKAVLEIQMHEGLKDLTEVQRLVIAYEPVWAIGTGHNATPEQAQQAHAFIRHQFGGLFGAEAADRVVIQYGGSVKPENAREILAEPDVDGALVGGASLKPDSFLAIVASAH